MQTLHNKYSCTDTPTPTKKKINSGSSDPDLFSWGSEGNLAVNKKKKIRRFISNALVFCLSNDNKGQYERPNILIKYGPYNFVLRGKEGDAFPVCM